ncbi:toll/interleukin-1 receptor domain-containing protein [Aquimarina sp. U1-2]|uniref:toll/interleukin-1 receptor domain-containing protein n=1 Tax=Aquimarina sp. U1-2 TaxID=2823141 RepID=UPI001AEC9532|nr:toll/interleukin-1 receptor domain-containing protein [Aquimarina sp. U1-2]MBP2833043.1 toll/interleukin-1 receptor domain-containing protein [Aquimarina sp. U1-2]
MDIKKRFLIEFGPGYNSFSYTPILKSGKELNFQIYSLLNLTTYLQFNVVVGDNLDENYKFIPQSLMAYKRTEDPTKTSVTPLLKQKEDFLNIPHTRNIYFYFNEISVNEKELFKFFISHQLRPIIRTNQYFEEMPADFFISHDSRDKDEIARPLYEELSKRGYKVWYDEYSLNIGDSLTESIERGISDSKFGILILSKNFLSNEKWAKNELQSLKTKQIIKNEKFLLPVWHGIKPDDLKDNYWLLDKVGGNTDKGIGSLADNLERVYKTA